MKTGVLWIIRIYQVDYLWVKSQANVCLRRVWKLGTLKFFKKNFYRHYLKSPRKCHGRVMEKSLNFILEFLYEPWSSTDFPVLVLVCPELAPALIAPDNISLPDGWWCPSSHPVTSCSAAWYFDRSQQQWARTPGRQRHAYHTWPSAAPQGHHDGQPPPTKRESHCSIDGVNGWKIFLMPFRNISVA